MTPHHEPMRGERTGITTASLVRTHGAITARGIDPAHRVQFVQCADGTVWSSGRWTADTWLPWQRVRTHNVHRYAAAIAADIERTEATV